MTKSAQEIAEALACEKADCSCARESNGERLTHCPAHNDSHPSLSLADTEDHKVLAICFSGCDQGDVIGALRNRGLWLGGAGVTLEELAEAKGLLVDFLKELGWRDGTWYDTASVTMPYYGGDGSVLFNRYRIGLTGLDRFRQPKGTKLAPYGMNRLAEARRTGKILLVEGETDCATAWLNGFAALGLPGANAWKASYTGLLEGLTVYVVREPDDGGDSLVEKVAGSLSEVKVIDLAGEVKDVNGLWLHVDRDRGRFRTELEKAIAGATPITEIRSKEEREEAVEAVEALAAAGDLPDQDNILGLLTEAIGAGGYAGDARAAVLIWIAELSRLLEKPLNVCLVSPSAAGKNHAIDSALSFAHPEGYYSLKASSPRALVYNDADFRHRVVVMAEADSIPDDSPAASAVRSLIEDAEMSYEVVEKDDSGKHAVRRIVKPGPTGLVTTAIRPLAEQMWTRVLEVGVSDTQDQTRAVLAAHAVSVNGDGPMPDAAPFIALDRWLELAGERRVTIPFAARLAELVPVNLVRMRRDFRQLLTVIQTVALLHQRQRSRDTTGRVVAGADDYRHARWLLEDVFSAVASGGVSAAVREAVLAVRDIYDGEHPVTVKAVGDQLNLARDAAWKRIQRAIDLGYLANQESRKGRPAQLVPGDPLPTERPALPTVEELFPDGPDSPRATGRQPRRQPSENADLDTESPSNGGVVARLPSIPGGTNTRTPVELSFMEEHVAQVLDGTKTQTSRTRGASKLEVGDIVKAKRGSEVFADLRIVDVQRKRLGDFDEDDAQREGGYTLEGFKEVWCRLHPRRGWNPEDKAWTIRFHVVEGGGRSNTPKPKATGQPHGESLSDPLSEPAVALAVASDRQPEGNRHLAGVGCTFQCCEAPTVTRSAGGKPYCEAHVPRLPIEHRSLLALAEEAGFPSLHLGERVDKRKKIPVGIPAGRFGWEQALRYWLPETINGLLALTGYRLVADNPAPAPDLAKIKVEHDPGNANRKLRGWELDEIRRYLPKPPQPPSCVVCGGQMPFVRVGDRHVLCGQKQRDKELKPEDGHLVRFAVQELGLSIAGRSKREQQDAVRGVVVKEVVDGWERAKKAQARERAKERRRERCSG